MQYQLDFTSVLFPKGEPRLEQVVMTSTDAVRDSIVTAFYNGEDGAVLEKMARDGFGLTETRP
jgi:hypothetical protein